MNGRLILAYLGYSILINLYTDLFEGTEIKKTKAIIITLISLILTMVSSGTMIVASSYVIIMILAINYGNFKKIKTIKTMILLILFSKEKLLWIR